MHIIFLNNKLISCDSILPLMMEIHQRTGERILFLCFDAETYEAIRRNFVLWDAIGRVGKLRCLARQKRGKLGWLFHRLYSGLFMLGLITASLVRNVHFYHFRMLNRWPFRMLYLVNRKRTHFCESDSFGEPKLMAAVGSVGLNRAKKKTPVGGHIIAFHPEFYWLGAPELAHLPRNVFGPTRVRKVWLDYVRERADGDFAREFARAGAAPSDEILAFMLGFFGYPGTIRNEPDLARALFVETLESIRDAAPGMPLFLKPHVFTDMNIVEDVLKKFRELPVVISYLHPTVLASRSKAFITNLYSTTQADARSVGVPTIEYTDYSDEALQLSGGGSMRPDMIDHFINRDRDELRRVLAQVARAPRRSLPVGRTSDDSGLFAALAAAS